MKYAVTSFFFAAFLLFQYNTKESLKKELSNYKLNTVALLETVNRLQLDSLTMALDVHTLRLSVDEYKKYRKEDAEQIEEMGIRIKDLETAANHSLQINASVDINLVDTVIIRDSVLVPLKTLKLETPHIFISGTIEKDRLIGDIEIPVKLKQYVWVEYKHRFLRWRWKPVAVHQTISSNNPYVDIEYSEFIYLQK